MAPQPRSRQDQELFRKEVQTFPVGTIVRASAALHSRLKQSRPGRARDKELTGKVIGLNDRQLRIIVRWDHPEYRDKRGHNGCVEHLAGRYLEVVPAEEAKA